MNLSKFSALGLALLLQLAATNAKASEISGVSPVNIGNNVYNITPQHKNSQTGIGFRQYEKFELSKGDTANFIMNDISKFINLAESKVNINGLVNTINSDYTKSNGSLIFISPEGFVVGPNGVLNVGALSVYTPTNTSYNELKTQLGTAVNEAAATGAEPLLEFNPSSLVLGSGVITVDGKIIANGNVNLKANSITVGKNGYILNGVNTGDAFVSYNKETGQAEYTNSEEVFNTLVNTDYLSDNSADINLETKGGNIELGGQVTAKNGSIIITANGGDIVNTGTNGTLIKSSGNLNLSANNVGEIPVNFTDLNGYTKSINVQVDGDVNANAQNSVNITSLDKNLYVDNIIAGDTVYLQVDKKENNNGTLPGLYSSVNHKRGSNVTAGKGISLTSVGNIGADLEDNGGKFSISSSSESQNFNIESWNNDPVEYTPYSNGSEIEVVSKAGNIRIKTDDKASNIKNITAEKGSIEAQFSGNTYIENLKSADDVNVVTLGEILYIQNLENMSVDSSTILETDLYSPASSIVVKNGSTEGVTFKTNNIYANQPQLLALDEPTFGDNDDDADIDNPNINLDTDDDLDPDAPPVSDDTDINVDNDDKNNTEPNIGDNDDDTDPDNPNINLDSDDDLDPDVPPVTGDIDTDDDKDNDIPPSGNDKDPDIGGDNDDDTDPDNPNINLDSDDDLDPDVPPVTGDIDTDDDKDNDIPPSGNGKDPDIGGDNDDDTDPDNPNINLDSDDDLDPDVPPVTGDIDTDDDKDNDIPSLDSDDDLDPDVPPVTGDIDTDDDKDNDIPTTTHPVTDKTNIYRPIGYIYKTLRPEMTVTPTENVEENFNQPVVNTNGLFGDTYQDKQVSTDDKKHNLYFKYRFK